MNFDKCIELGNNGKNIKKMCVLYISLYMALFLFLFIKDVIII